jgi:D-amino acid aminotransferase
MLQQQFVELAELAGGFIHEIKNHLSTLGLNLQLLSEDFGQPQSQRDRRSLERIQRLQGECGRLVDVSNDFLRFARVKDLELQPVAVGALVEEMVDFFGPTARQANLEIKVYVPADLPPVLLDQDLFKQALLNLLLNAQQAMTDGGELTIQAVREPDWVVLVLIDTGKGMTDEVQSKIFRPFFSTRPGGSGLGLPTVRKIVEAHGGAISVESEVSRGTKFTIRLPVPPASANGSAKGTSVETIANLNGKQMPLAEVMVPALDRGFLFGDAVYEVIRICQGKPFLMAEHMQRLARSLDAIRIAGVDLPRMEQRIRETIAAGKFQEATVYIQVTRGAGAKRTHPFPPQAMPLEFFYVQEFVDPYLEARQHGAAVTVIPDIRWDRCDIKSTNLLPNVLAAQAAKDAGCVEAIFIEKDGTLCEGSHTSLFGVLDGRLLTAPNSNAILPGITRGLVLKLAERAKIPLREHVFKQVDLPKISELFLTGTTSEVLPIVRVDSQQIGDGKPGPVTRRLQEAYQQAVCETAE